MKHDHLNDEQFAELLAGNTNDASAVSHVESCAACREELALMGAALGDLRTTSLRQAEQRASRIQVALPSTPGWGVVPAWGASLAAVLICGVAIGGHMRESRDMEPALRPAHAVAAPTDDEVAKDNRLMRSIESEISEQITPQVPETESEVSSRETPHRVIREVVN